MDEAHGLDMIVIDIGGTVLWASKTTSMAPTCSLYHRDHFQVLPGVLDRVQPTWERADGATQKTKQLHRRGGLPEVRLRSRSRQRTRARNSLALRPRVAVEARQRSRTEERDEESLPSPLTRVDGDQFCLMRARWAPLQHLRSMRHLQRLRDFQELDQEQRWQAIDHWRRQHEDHLNPQYEEVERSYWYLKGQGQRVCLLCRAWSDQVHQRSVRHIRRARELLEVDRHTRQEWLEARREEVNDLGNDLRGGAGTSLEDQHNAEEAQGSWC